VAIATAAMASVDLACDVGRGASFRRGHELERSLPSTLRRPGSTPGTERYHEKIGKALLGINPRAPAGDGGPITRLTRGGQMCAIGRGTARRRPLDGGVERGSRDGDDGRRTRAVVVLVGCTQMAQCGTPIARLLASAVARRVALDVARSVGSCQVARRVDG